MINVRVVEWQTLKDVRSGAVYGLMCILKNSFVQVQVLPLTIDLSGLVAENQSGRANKRRLYIQETKYQAWRVKPPFFYEAK